MGLGHLGHSGQYHHMKTRLLVSDVDLFPADEEEERSRCILLSEAGPLGTLRSYSAAESNELFSHPGLSEEGGRVTAAVLAGQV